MMKPRKATHRWTTHDRELLVLLKLRYSRKCILPIFNHLLSSRLSQEGFQNGVSAPSLDAQYNEMKGGGGGHDIYARISSATNEDTNTKYGALLRDINLAIRALRLDVQPKSRIKKPAGQPQQSRLVTRRIRPRGRVQESETPFEPEPAQTFVRSRLQKYLNHSPNVPSQEPTHTPINNSHQDFGVDEDITIPPTPIIYTDINDLPAPKRPLLLFRMAGNANVFRSRRYADVNKPVLPPAKFGTKDYYENAARPHLERCRKWDSPLISFGQSASNVIGRLENARSEECDVKKFLAIFAFNHLEADATRNFGPGSGPHPASGLFAKNELSDLPKGYKGNGEWLMYGYVSCQPLVVLDSFQAITLARAIRRFRTGDISALADVSKSLRDVPGKWKEAVSYIILKSYCSKKLPAVGTPAYNEMMGVIISGRRITSIAETIDLSRLSFAHETSDDDDYDDTEEITTPYSRLPPNPNVGRIAQPVQSTAPTGSGSFVPSTQRVNSVIRNLNFLASRSALEEVPQNAVKATPFWSPEPSEEINDVPNEPHSTRNQAQASPLHEVVSLDEDDDEDDWELINADLEKSFINSFPSASKKADNFQAKIPQAGSDFDFEDEGQDFPLPSIEKEKPSNDENSYGRGSFLRGLAQFAGSMSPPILETPSKMPREPASSRIFNSRANDTSFLNKNQWPAAGTPKFQQYQPYATKKPTRTQNPVSERPGLARVIPSSNNGSRGTATKTDPSDLNFNARPGTNIHTRVPVIVRKKIVDTDD